MYAESVLDPAEIAPLSVRPLKRAEYDRMVELGLFEEDERIELLRGSLVSTRAAVVAPGVVAIGRSRGRARRGPEARSPGPARPAPAGSG